MINYLHCYVNDRLEVDWNTCGQAAIATISDYWGRNPYGLVRREYDSANQRWYWDDSQAIDAIKNGGFGPDVVFGWGTTGGRVRDALRGYGLNASLGHSGFASWGWENLWQSLRNYVNWNRPVAVMIDLGAIGGPWWCVHWAIAYNRLKRQSISRKLPVEQLPIGQRLPECLALLVPALRVQPLWRLLLAREWSVTTSTAGSMQHTMTSENLLSQ
jgi:hypothetical protein